MNELLTAAEKRKQYESATDEKSQAELKMVIEKINDASGLCIYLSKGLSKPVEEILKGKGYTCGYVASGYNESEYKIAW